MKAFDTNITSGRVTWSVWILAWPAVLHNLINGLHGFVDHLLVGNFISYEANAGIGVAWQFFLVMVVFIASLFHGMGVLIARYAGKGDREAVSKVAYNTFLSSLIILVFITAPIGYVISPHLLAWANASAAVQVHALPYLRILFACSGPLFLMFMLNGAFHASGDPKTPLKLGILTTLLNVVLSAILITGVGPAPKLGATGAAIGTCLAPLPSVAIALRLIVQRKMIIQPPKKLTLIPDLSVMKTVARIGIPAGVQAVLLNIGGAILLAIIGSLEHSAAAQAAYTICYSQLFSFVTWAAFGFRAAAATMMGQNIGAGDPNRGKAGVLVAVFLGTAWASLLGIVYWVLPETLLGLFDATDEPVRTFGVSLLRYLAVSGVFLAATLSFTGGLQGAGDTKTPMWIALITQIGILLGVCALYHVLGMLTANAVWSALLIAHISRLLFTCAAFQQGRWTRVKVELEPKP